jgi:hypothetical protein
MASLIQKLITGLLIAWLKPLLDWIVSHEVLSHDETLQLVTGFATWVIPGALAVWAAVRSHRDVLIALVMKPGATLRDFLEAKKGGATTAVMTPTDAPPILKPPPASFT